MSCLTEYQNQNPYEGRASKASVNFHKSEASQRLAYKYKQQLPADARYFVSQFVSMKNTKQKLQLTAEKIEQGHNLALLMNFYANREWIFDSSSMLKLNSFLANSDRQAF